MHIFTIGTVVSSIDVPLTGVTLFNIDTLFYSFEPTTDGTQKPTSTDHLRSHLSNHIMFAFVSAGI